MKDVSHQQVTEHIKRLNPWWETGVIDEPTSELRPRASRDVARVHSRQTTPFGTRRYPQQKKNQPTVCDKTQPAPHTL